MSEVLVTAPRMMHCRNCKQDLPEEQFYPSMRKYERARCKTCTSKPGERPPADPNHIMFCGRCEQHLSEEQFYPSARTRDRATCKPCLNASVNRERTLRNSRTWRERHPEHQQIKQDERTAANQEWKERDPAGWTSFHREQTLRNAYGLTIAQWESMFDAQGRCCKSCRSPEPNTGKGWHTDHCHATGVVRGVLCGRCNSGIGFFNDDPWLLRSAAAYLSQDAERVDEHY